jgi:hypothetical protein
LLAAEKAGDEGQLLEIEVNLARHYQSQKEFDLAREHWEKLQQMAKKHEIQQLEATVLFLVT